MKITSQKEFLLLARKRVNFEVEHPEKATPSRESIKSEAAKQLGTKPELVSVRHVYSKFGQNSSKAIVHVYEDEKTLKFLETPKGKKVKAAEPAAKK